MGILVMSYMRMHLCAFICTVQCTQGTNRFEGVIHPARFEGVFWTDIVEGVHLFARICTVHIW